jgi:hypothetical protein
MKPANLPLLGHDSQAWRRLTEPGPKYVAIDTRGEFFTLKVTTGDYRKNDWFVADTGRPMLAPNASEPIPTTRPIIASEWVLILRD